MAWEKTKIILENGEVVLDQAPIIISASRSTDIPAFYSDWFKHRLEVGYSSWTNPFNGVKSYISYDKVRMIVFWSKNPRPLLKEGGCLDYLKKRKINSYIQYTLNDYVSEGLEKGVPSVEERIDTFKRLVDYLGFGKVIWRFDPLILTDRISLDDLLEKALHIGDALKGYTEKMVFSFADISSYRKVQANLQKNNINYREFLENDMLTFADELSKLNKGWNYELATCGEKIDLDRFGIQHNRCIDDDLMAKYFHDDSILMDFLGIKVVQGLFGCDIVKTKNNKDKGQRKLCGCIICKDIGEYNTCPHLCEYCYANASKEQALANYHRHCLNPMKDTITGK